MTSTDLDLEDADNGDIDGSPGACGKQAKAAILKGDNFFRTYFQFVLH